MTACCRAASGIPPWNSRCKIELIFGVMLQFNVVWCIRSRREIVLTIESDNGKQGYKVGGKKYCCPKVVLPRGPCERYSSDWIRRRDQSWARSVRMTVHLFSGTWSPSVCTFALQQTARDHSKEFEPTVINTVWHHFYVDDCLKSFRQEEEAIQMATDLPRLLERGGFRLHKWLTNRSKALQAISETERAARMQDWNQQALPAERALDILWDVSTDTFTYAVKRTNTTNETGATGNSVFGQKEWQMSTACWVWRCLPNWTASFLRCLNHRIRISKLSTSRRPEGSS